MIDLPQQYSQLCALLDNFLVGVITVSASNEIVSINKSAEAIIGCKESELVGKSCSNTFVRELCGGECRFGKTFHLQEEQGRTTAFQGRSITTVVSPLADRGKTGQGCVVVIQDHSAFKELIDRVRNEDRRLKIILDNLDIGILTVDRGGHITFFNSMAEAITGFSRGDILEGGLRLSSVRNPPGKSHCSRRPLQTGRPDRTKRENSSPGRVARSPSAPITWPSGMRTAVLPEAW